MMTVTDFTVSDQGSLFLLTPISDAADNWCEEHLPEDAIRWGPAYAVEHRYIVPIVNAIVGEGLEVSVS